MSKETATYKFIETASYVWNSKKCVLGVSCYLTKAFDSVNHKLFKKKNRLLWCEGFTFRLVWFLS